MPPRRGVFTGQGESGDPAGEGLQAEASLSQAPEVKQGPRWAPWGGQLWPRSASKGAESAGVGKARLGAMLEK